jgi:hypothetical protein
MDRLQLLRSVLAIFSAPDTPSLLLDTAASALVPHVQHFLPKQAAIILHLCAKKGFKHAPLCLSLATYVSDHHAKLTHELRKAIAADFLALGWLSPGLSVALEEPGLAGKAARSGKGHKASTRGKLGYQVSDGLKALKEQGMLHACRIKPIHVE